MATTNTKVAKAAKAPVDATAPESTPVEAAKIEEKAPVQDRYAPESKDLTPRVLAAKAAGWTNRALVDLTGLDGTYSAVWRASNFKIHAREVDTWKYALDQIESGKVQPPAKAQASTGSRIGRDALLIMNTKAITYLEQGNVDDALRVLRGEDA